MHTDAWQENNAFACAVMEWMSGRTYVRKKKEGFLWITVNVFPV